MDGLAMLLIEARAAGLVLRAEGDRLVIRGPSKAEALAQRLLDKKVELLSLLSGEAKALPAPDMSADDELAREREAIQEEADPAPDGASPGAEDNEVLDEAHAMLSRNPTFGWTWEQALERARRIIAHKRGQKLQATPKDFQTPVKMTPTGCVACGSADYWVSGMGMRFCLECYPAFYKDVIAIGTIQTAEEEVSRPSKRRRAGGGRATR